MKVDTQDVECVQYALDILNDQMEACSDDPKTEINRIKLEKLLTKLKNATKNKKV